MNLRGCFILAWGLALTLPSFGATNLVTNTGDSGPGSLREAITLANTNPGVDHIYFPIAAGGVQTITTLTELPTITDALVLDGYTQPGASTNTLAQGDNAVLLIRIDGA